MDNVTLYTVNNGYIAEVEDFDTGDCETHVFNVFQHMVDFLTVNLDKPFKTVSQAH